MNDGSTRLAAALADRYRIERALGAGGMATVYLAEDLKHDRKVAIKVLKPELAAVLGAERFVQEIKTTAALSHPHILPLFDSGTADGFLFYVMPYIQGETIREKLNRETQFGVDEAVRIAREVADALDYAHRHGVIHRDIKPENILLHDGRPMVMDFGIALAVSAAAGGRMTETGLSLGTPHYMSPEQATADKQITARSDVYSLASVLYEMLTGEPPHMGTSAQQIIMKIIAEPVRPAAELRKAVPPNVSAALARALEKLPADRFESAKAFADALGDRSFETAMTTATTPGQPESRRVWQLVSAALALTTLASLGVAIASRERAPRAGLSRYEVLLGEDAAEDVRPILSPSGEWVGWASEGGPLMLRRRGATAAVAIPGTIGALIVAFSPDDSAIAFVSLRSLHVVPLSGGTPNQLADVGSPLVAWGPDGWIYFTNRDRGIARIRPSGGRPEEVVRPDSLARLLGASQVLPDGAGSLLVSIAERSNRATVAVWDGRTRELTRLTEGGAPAFLAQGYLVFARRDSTLWGARFELRRHQMVGEPVQLESGVVGGPLPAMALSAEGTLLYRSGGQSLSGRLSRVGRDGRVSPLALESEGWFRGVRVSPDGRRLAFGTWSTASRSFIRLHDLSIGSTRDLVPGWNTYDPVWSLDGRRVAFHSSERTDRDSGGPGGEYRGFDVAISAEGEAPRQLYRRPGLVAPDAWAPDGRLIVRGTADAARGGNDLFLVSLAGDTVRSERLLDAPWSESMSRLSPDGQWLAYVGSPRDSAQVFVRPFPDVSAGVVQVSERAGTAPVWSRDGRTLYYLDASRADTSGGRRDDGLMDLMAVRVRTSPTLSVESRAVVLPRLRYQHPLCCSSNYDALPDGSGFIMAIADSGGARSQMILVEGLLHQLRAVVGR